MLFFAHNIESQAYVFAEQQSSLRVQQREPNPNWML